MKLINVITNEELKRPIVEEDFTTTRLVLNSSEMAKIKWIDKVYRLINGSPFNYGAVDVNEAIDSLLRTLQIDKIFIDLSEYSDDWFAITNIQSFIDEGVFKDADHINKIINGENDEDDLNYGE